MADGEIEAMLAKHAISEQIYRYCRAMDRADIPLGYSIWHEDGTADYGPNYVGTGRGFIDWAKDFHFANAERHSHQVSNILIRLNGDDSADSESYFTATLRMKREEGPVDIVISGRYLDRWEKRAGHWAITHRQCLGDLQHSGVLTNGLTVGGGTRDTNDPSYRLTLWRAGD